MMIIMITKVANPNALISHHRVVSGMEEEEDEEEMEDGGEDSFGEEDDMLGVSDVTSQLAAAGWQHGVNCLVTSDPPAGRGSCS